MPTGTMTPNSSPTQKSPTRSRRVATGVRKTHRTLKSALPLFAALVSVIGASAAILDEVSGQRGHATTRPGRLYRMTHGGSTFDITDGSDDEEFDEDFADEEEEVRSYSPLHHLVTLLSFGLEASILLVANALVVVLMLSGGPTVSAVLLTALSLGCLWLTATVSRRAA